MVNRGVSRGCGTCKQRRKKCDETRPVCKACVRTGHHCQGYKSDGDLVFRYYANTDQDARQGGPVNPPGPKPQDPDSASDKSSPVSPEELHMTDGELEKTALDVFLRDYCVKPADPSLSRGYLQGVAGFIEKTGGYTAVANAGRVVALDDIGRKWKRQALRDKAQWLYQAELRAFQSRITNERLKRRPETLMIVTLFGIYEMLATPFPVESGHIVHALGITAILGTYNSPFSLFDVQVRNDENRFKGKILTPPIAENSFIPSLDAFSLDVAPLFARYYTIFGIDGEKQPCRQEMYDLFFDAEHFFERIQHWANNQHPEWQPKCVGIAGDAQRSGPYGAYFWPGRVDAYLDLWIATVWITYRKGAIMLATMIAKCRNGLPGDEEVAAIADRVEKQGHAIVEAMISSIPYLMLSNVESAFDGSKGSLKPAAPIAAVLAMYPIYIVARQKESVTEAQRAHLFGCLKLMGEWQGLGQAEVLAENPSLGSKLGVVDAHTILWAGMAT